MSVQYQTVVDWDPTLADLEFLDTDTLDPAFQGLVQFAVKTTTGTPAATPYKFAKAAQIQNIVDGTWYENTGSTASPTWSLVPSTGSGITQLTGDVTAGPGTGSQATSVVKIQGIAPKSVAIHDAIHTTVGGAASEDFTITGVVATDRVYVTLSNDGTANISIKTAVKATGKVTVVFSANPGNDAVLNILVTRSTGL